MTTRAVLKHRQEELQEQEPQGDSPLLQEKLANCHPQLAVEIRAMYKNLNDLASTNLARMWAQGKRLQAIKDREDEYRKPLTGDQPIDPLEVTAEVLSSSQGYLNKMQQLYRAFPTEADRRRLLGLRFPHSGKPLTWSHFEYLLKVFSPDGDNSRFNDLLAQTLAGEWKPEQVDQAIKSWRRLNGQPESRPGGRPTHVPPTLQGRLQRLIQQTDVVVKNDREIYSHESHGFVHALSTLSQEEVANKAAELQDLTGRLKTNLASLVGVFKRQIEVEIPEMEAHIERCLRSESRLRGLRDAESLEAEDEADD